MAQRGKVLIAKSDPPEFGHLEVHCKRTDLHMPVCMHTHSCTHACMQT